MREITLLALACMTSIFKSRAALCAENLALRHQRCVFQRSVKKMGINEVLTAPHSPWQNPYSERLNGSIRRECLDRVIIFNERHLRRVLTKYFDYYNRYRVHQSLEMDTPAGRTSQTIYEGNVIAIPHVEGLHYHYERKAA